MYVQLLDMANYIWPTQLQQLTQSLTLPLQIDGVAYRGRVMMELGTSLGTLPMDKHEEVKLADQTKILVCGDHRRCTVISSNLQ